MKLWTNNTDWFVAADQDDLKATYVEYYGDETDSVGHMGPITDWRAVPDDQSFALHEDDDPTGSATVKTAAEWAASNGRGFLCSTEV